MACVSPFVTSTSAAVTSMQLRSRSLAAIASRSCGRP